MERFMDEHLQPYTDVSTVESQRNDLVPEEFPDGPYGTDLMMESFGKSTPWRSEQRPPNRFSYENHTLHASIDRDYPGEDDYNSTIPEVHDEP